MFISKKKLRELEDRINSLESDTVVDVSVDWGSFFRNPLAPMKTRQLKVNDAFNMLTNALGLEFERGEATISKDRFVKKKSNPKLIKKKR